MSTNTLPCLVETETGVEHELSRRIVTVGSSPSCRIRIADKNLPEIAAHVSFDNGRYRLSILSPDVKVSVNNKAVPGYCELCNGDAVRIGRTEFTYRETALVQAGAAAPVSTAQVSVLISTVVSLLRNRDEDVTSDLIVSVARLVGCDAARLVCEDPATGELKTVARYPIESGLDRFSNRAIDFAKNASKTVLVNDTDWKDSVDPQGSLVRNLVASVLCAPLSYEGAILGYIYLDKLQANRPFAEEDRALCDSLLPLFSELLANSERGRRQAETIARLQAVTLETSAGMIYESDTMSALTGAWLRVMAGEAWVGYERQIVTDDQATGKLTWSEPVNQLSMLIPRRGNKFIVFGKLNLLDAPGEWYWDPNAQMLYVWTQDGASPAGRIEAGTAPAVLNLSNQSYHHRQRTACPRRMAQPAEQFFLYDQELSSLCAQLDSRLRRVQR